MFRPAEPEAAQASAPALASSPPLPIPLDTLAISARSYKRLIGMGVTHLDDLQEWTEERLRALDGIGEHSVQEIRQLMSAHGLRFVSSSEHPPRTTPYKLGLQQRAEVRRRWASGEDVDALCRDFQVTRTTIYRTCLNTPRQVLMSNRGPRPNPKIAARNQEIRRRRASGEGLVTLAQEFGISRQYVHMICNGIHAQKEPSSPPLSAREKHYRQIATIIQQEYRTSRAACKYLGITRFTLHEYLHAGKLPGAFQVEGPGSDWLIPLASLEAYKNREKQPRPRRQENAAR